MSEHVILVAVSVEAETRADAHRMVEAVMPSPGGERFVSLRGLRRARLESWWVAEDDRGDGSDCDSAVFVDPTRQREAERVLRAAGLASGQGLGFPWSGMNVRCIDDGCDNDMSELMCPNDRRSCLDHCGEDDH